DERGRDDGGEESPHVGHCRRSTHRIPTTGVDSGTGWTGSGAREHHCRVPDHAAILDDLAARGLIHDSTDLDALRARLAEGPITLYYGCDPSADSLHVGNL